MSICVVAGLAVGGMHAYFSDVETSTDNVFTAGTIDLQVNDENPWASAAVNGELTDLKPCETGEVTIILENVGSNPMDVWKLIKDVATEDGTETEPESSEAPANDIDGVIRYSMSAAKTNGSTNDPAATATIEEDENFTISDGSHQLDGETSAVKEQYIYLGEMAPGDVWEITQGYHMDAYTTNWAQGDTMTFTIEFYAQQTVGEAPSPSPELLGHGK
jgi:predicted ribosomally synthesized peptide with SipW-like signal peptide